MNWVYRKSDGQWCLRGGPDPALYLSNQVDYGMADVPGTPDPRTEKWDGAANVGRSQAEIAAYDTTQPKLIDTREWFRRWTPQERARLRAVARNNDAVADLYEETISGATVNLNDQRVIDGLQQLTAVMVPSVWADAAAADARIAELRA
jgi:hypothetical protein